MFAHLLTFSKSTKNLQRFHRAFELDVVRVPYVVLCFPRMLAITIGLSYRRILFSLSSSSVTVPYDSRGSVVPRCPFSVAEFLFFAC